MWRIRYALQVLKDDRGIGVVEVILILVVLIGLVIIFKSQLTSLVQTIFEKISYYAFERSGRLQIMQIPKSAGKAAG